MNRGLVVAVLLVAAVAIPGTVLDAPAMARAWLLAALLGLSLPLGAMPLLMTHNLTGGRWGEPVRAPLRAIVATLPAMLLLFLPLFAAIPALFAWALPVAELSELLYAKHFYLNLPFFLARFLVYAITWLWLAIKLDVWRKAETRPRRISAAGLVAWGITVTFFSFDWIMALEPEWYSDIFGLTYMGSLLSMAPALLFLLPAVPWTGLAEDERRVARRDLALLWLAAMLFWVFASFSQYLVIWSGDLPHEIGWYLHRNAGGWQWFALGALLLGGVVPLAVLLPAGWQRHEPVLGVLAGLVLIGHVLEFAWLVLPAYYPARMPLGWRSPLAIAAVAVLGLALYRRHRARAAGGVHG